MMTCSKELSKKKCLIIGVFGIFLCIFGTAFLLCFPMIFSDQLSKQIILEEGTIAYNLWQNIPLPIFQKIYFYNVTNPEDVVNGAIPHVEEIGPYTYRSYWVKKDIGWHPDATVTYREVKTFHFLRNLSVGGEDDMITTINAPMLTASTLLKNTPFWLKIIASISLKVFGGEGLFVSRNVSDLTYNGYSDIIMKLATLLPGIPDTQGKFAWLYGKNATDDGLYKVFTGKDDLNKLNVIDTWNGSSMLHFWKGECNMINGTNGEINPPIRTFQPFITFFQSLFCRSLNLYYDKEVDHMGVTSYRYKSTADTFANGTLNPDNACFDTGMNLMSGAFDVSACQNGAPAILSLPHFYLADSAYRNFVTGLLPPNASRDEFYLDLEPTTGIGVAMAARFQVNILLEHIPFIQQLQYIKKKTVLPILWSEIVGNLNADLADTFYSQLKRPETIVYSVCYTLIALGILFLVILGILLVNHFVHSKKKRKSLYDEEDDPLLDPGMNSHSKSSYTDKVSGDGNGPVKSEDPAGRDI